MDQPLTHHFNEVIPVLTVVNLFIDAAFLRGEVRIKLRNQFATDGNWAVDSDPQSGERLGARQ
jgi:hypothetical protein